MLNMFPVRRSNPERTSRPRVVIVGERDRRTVVKAVLGNAASIVGELESDARIQMLDAVQPDIIIIDSTSRYVNPLRSLAQIAHLRGTTRIVLLASGARTRSAVQSALATEYNVMVLDIHAAGEALSEHWHREQPAQHGSPKRSYAHVAA